MATTMRSDNTADDAMKMAVGIKEGEKDARIALDDGDHSGRRLCGVPGHRADMLARVQNVRDRPEIPSMTAHDSNLQVQLHRSSMVWFHGLLAAVYHCL